MLSLRGVPPKVPEAERRGKARRGNLALNPQCRTKAVLRNEIATPFRSEQRTSVRSEQRTCVAMTRSGRPAGRLYAPIQERDCFASLAMTSSERPAVTDWA